jgi:acyl-CoA synthetase (AMP-forming)/AMP-acid ligase II
MIPSGHPIHLQNVFSSSARYFGDRTAIVFGNGNERTHRELYRRGLRLAAGLESLGLRRQDRIAVLSMNTVEFIESYVAGWCAGIIVATVNFRLAVPEILYILNDVSPRLLIVEAQYLPIVEEIRDQVRGLEHIVVIGGSGHGLLDFETLITDAPADQPSFATSEDDIAALLYTSGTTGRPKGCILGQRELAFNTQVIAQGQGNRAEDRFLCVMPLFHIGGMSLILSVLAKGGTVFVHRQFDPVQVIDTLERERINMILLAPTMVQMVLERPEIEGRDLTALESVFYSAAPMPSTVLRRGIARLGQVFLQELGSSEGCSIAYLPRSLHQPDGTPKEQARLTSVGFPFPTVGLRVVDENGVDCATGEPGELLLKSPVMFRGYWNNSIATAEAVRDGWFHTGDIGRFDEDGFLYLVDRKKDMIISGGENIYSREVEEAILTHPAVSEVAVIGLPDETWGETVCAVIVLVPGKAATESEIIQHTRSLIASYKKPSTVRFVAALPKIASGKVDKKVLRTEHAPRG